MPYATGFEYIFAMAMLVGCASRVWCAFDAMQDRRAVVSSEHCTEAAWIMAHKNVRGEYTATLMSLAFVGLSVLALLTPHQDPILPPTTETVRVCALLLFIVATFNFAVVSVADVVDRMKVRIVNGQPHRRPK